MPMDLFRALSLAAVVAVLAPAPGLNLYDLILTETEITLPVPVIEVN